MKGAMGSAMTPLILLHFYLATGEELVGRSFLLKSRFQSNQMVNQRYRNADILSDV
jgi:hypothetical protein